MTASDRPRWEGAEALEREFRLRFGRELDDDDRMMTSPEGAGVLESRGAWYALESTGALVEGREVGGQMETVEHWPDGATRKRAAPPLFPGGN